MTTPVKHKPRVQLRACRTTGASRFRHESSLWLLRAEKTNPPSPRLRRDSFSLTREWGRGAVDCAWHAPLHAARKDAGPPRPVIDFRRRRRGRCFTLGGGSADGVRVRVFATRVPGASPRLFMFGGLLLRFAQPRRGESRSITSLVASVRTLANCPPAERWRHYAAGSEV
jgi:hypothetical protein